MKMTSSAKGRAEEKEAAGDAGTLPSSTFEFDRWLFGAQATRAGCI